MSDLIDETDIAKLVQAFYSSVRYDPLLAPIFATKIGDKEWPDHIEHITDFWSSIFLKTGRFDGNPMRKHMAIEGLTPAHFTHWLILFKKTADKVLLPQKSEAIYSMAQRIGQSLQMGLAFNFEKSGQTDHPFTEFSVRPQKQII